MITLETSRLLMRQFITEDAKHMVDLNNDPEVMKYTGDLPFKDLQEALDLINHYDQYSKYGLGRLTVLRKSDHVFLGWCGLKCIDSGEIDLGYRFKQEFWNQGYAWESCQAVLDFGFKREDIHTIIGRTSIENLASVKLLEKLGMKYIKEFDHDGIPSKLYAIDKTDYLRISNKDH